MKVLPAKTPTMCVHSPDLGRQAAKVLRAETLVGPKSTRPREENRSELANVRAPMKLDLRDHQIPICRAHSQGCELALRVSSATSFKRLDTFATRNVIK
jgi:hypothetical protein